MQRNAPVRVIIHSSDAFMCEQHFIISASGDNLQYFLNCLVIYPVIMIQIFSSHMFGKKNLNLSDHSCSTDVVKKKLQYFHLECSEVKY